MQFEPIGTIRTCYKEKFGIPRQHNLVLKAPGTLVFNPEYAREEAVRGLEGFSHVWLLFVFHGTAGTADTEDTNAERVWSPMVRPPRLGGNKKVGVFASRSPFRPNPIGMSAVRLQSIEMSGHGPVLHLTGVDILDNTPILDVKPYLPYSDIIPDARDGFATAPPKASLNIIFSDQAMDQIRVLESQYPDLLAIITGILKNDPRPAYQTGQKPDRSSDRIFGIRLFDFDLKLTVQDDQILVIELIRDPDI